MLWNAAKQGLPWLPQTANELASLVSIGAHMLIQSPMQMPLLAVDMFRSVGSHLTNNSNLRTFIDGQLLISAQTTSQYANALYGASALDLPRRGVAHVQGGMGRIAELLADAVRRNGGQVLYRHKASRVVMRNQKIVAVETNDGKQIPADVLICNLSPHDAATILGDSAPSSLHQLTVPDDGWGAFILYVGLDDSIVPNNFALHHQVIVREPMGEGNTVFLSLSAANDASRAPSGKRALTISTHTRLKPWWQLFEHDRVAYDARKDEYMQRLLDAAKIVLPNLRKHTHLVMPGTPITFQRFTYRSLGWVGGFPQTNLFRVRSPRVAKGMWLVGDSIFPGQSVPAVTLGGMRVANAVLHHVVDTTQKYISLASKEYAHG
jgi:phytoene dehydrogenase-like protein